MEEHDIQIRGHKVRLPLDVFVVATANPEDYTNRGRIITPLKDRYGSQIRTHYPRNVEDEVGIIEQESVKVTAPGYNVTVPDYMPEIIAEVTRLARRSPDVNQRSGVSVRASVADYEALVSNALRRAISMGEHEVAPRISDLAAIRATLEGKVEFETVEDGREDQVIERLIQGAVVAVFNRRCSISDLEPVTTEFKAGTAVDTGEALPLSHYQDLLKQVEGLPEAVAQVTQDTNPAVQAAAVEFVLEGLHLNKRLNKDAVSGQARYRG
jgi:magnesium chelatase subunit I